ncbi:triphosphoribosyl-dephospho-CoA synthase MdcB [Mycobacterium sp. OAE908]|uniref:triphosphoribosyl-dephospho-CoA synthase MdcB n=1 Tax=Mycobacterium sp. OAE908 TaxID=2817899 RepID=UPI001AEB5898
MTTAVRLPSEQIADTAVDALRTEALLTPKPGLVDAADRHSHPDMSLALLACSAETLREPLRQCADAARDMPLGPGLRARIGAIGRAGERRMLATTGGVNTHRGALWALGLLCAGVAGSETTTAAVAFAAHLARLPDPARGHSLSHGERARLRYGATGAAGEAQQGFPHVVARGLPMLRCGRHSGISDDAAALNALMAIMARLDDTCVLHRGGRRGLTFVQRSAAGVLRSGGCATPAGRRRLERFCRAADRRGLSMGGSADLLAATLFLDSVAPEGPICKR